MWTIIRLELRRLRWLVFLAPVPLVVAALGLVMPEALAAVLYVAAIIAFLFCTVAAVAVSVARWGADMEDPSFAVLLTMPVSRSWFFTGRLLAGLLIVTWTVVWSWLAILVGAELESAKHLGELSNYMPFLAMLAPETALPTVATFLYGFFALAMFVAALAVPWRSGMVVALALQVALGIALGFYLRWALHQPDLVMNQQVLLLPVLLAPAGLVASFVGYRLISIPQGHRAGWVLATWLGVGALCLAAVPLARALAVGHLLAPQVTVVATSPNGRYAVVRLDYGTCPLLDSPRQEASFSLAQATAYVDCETGRARLLADRELPPPIISPQGRWVAWQDLVGRDARNHLVNGQTGVLASFGLPPRTPNPYAGADFPSQLFTFYGWSATERLAALEYTRRNPRPPRPAGLSSPPPPSWWQWGRPSATDHSWPTLGTSFGPRGGARHQLRVVDESGRVLFSDSAAEPFAAGWAESGETLTFSKGKRQYCWQPGVGVAPVRLPIPSFHPRYSSGGTSPNGRWVVGEIDLRPRSASGSPSPGDPLKGPFDRRLAFLEVRTGKITLGPVGSEFAFYSWSPDSKYVVYLERPGIGPVALSYLSPSGAARRVPLPQMRYDGGSLEKHIFISGHRVVGGSWDENFAHGWHYHEYYPKPQRLSAMPDDLRYRWGTLLVSGGYVYYGQGPYLVREMPGEGKERFDLRRLRSGLIAVADRG